MKTFLQKRTSKILLATLVLSCLSVIRLSAQTTYTIDNGVAASASNYANFTSAVNELDGIARTDGGPNNGLPTGNVTFLVTTGETFSESPIRLTYTNPSA